MMSGWYDAPGRLLARRGRGDARHSGLHRTLASIVYALAIVAIGLLIAHFLTKKPAPAPVADTAAPAEPSPPSSSSAVTPAHFPDAALTGLPAASTAADGFAPLQSQAVRDAIHSALRTGRNQRWQDGAWSGYAVPSLTADARGCRMIRYTVDQRPGAPYESITACE